VNTSFVLVQGNGPYPVLPAIAPKSFKDNPLAYLEIWILKNDEEVTLITFSNESKQPCYVKYCPILQHSWPLISSQGY